MRTHQGTSLVECGTDAGTLCAVVLDSPESAPWLSVGQDLSLLFKESEVWMLPPGEAHAVPHRLRGTVAAVHEGVLMARVELDTRAGKVVSFVDRAWLASLSLTVGDALELGVHPAAVALQKEAP